MHGGASPQVRAKAAERIAALFDPAIARLQKLIDAKSEMVQLLAVQDILKRLPKEEEGAGSIPPFVVKTESDPE
jgi:hypothetical protein